eukprot:3262201-Amphidinium_carterae.2
MEWRVVSLTAFGASLSALLYNLRLFSQLLHSFVTQAPASWISPGFVVFPSGPQPTNMDLILSWRHSNHHEQSLREDYS